MKKKKKKSISEKVLFHVINTQRTEFSFPAKMPDYFEINTSINIVGSYKIVFSVRTEFQRDSAKFVC